MGVSGWAASVYKMATTTPLTRAAPLLLQNLLHTPSRLGEWAADECVDVWVRPGRMDG